MAPNATQATASRVEPAEDLSEHFRSAIAERCRQADVLFPAALDLEAAVLEALHREINGRATELRGVHSPARWREALRGERSFHLADLCRLATTPAREARAAVQAALALLRRSVDEHRPSLGITLAGRFSDLATAATAALGDLAKAQEDGRIDACEEVRLLKVLDGVDAAMRDARALVERKTARP
jgi:hypothetical protein